MAPVSMMQAHHVPGIIQSGLLLRYDSANTNSYPSSGVQWYDLSGNGNTGAFVATPVVTGNMLQLISNRVTVPWPYTNLNDITVSFWWYHTSNNISQYILSFTAGGGDGLFFDINDKDAGAIYRTIWVYWNSLGDNLAALQTTGSNGDDSDFTDGVLRQYTFRRQLSDTVKCRHYVNGIEVTTGVRTAGDQTQALFTNSNYQLVIGSPSTNAMMGSVLVYNRALSPAEILNNYNVEAGKFH